ncbi:hypothetical protein QQS21_002459 [Conoideocrella luteorostrata]|uniref:NACHT domain-containing protein n=1 Tax=Conoideocrella luteorostrata TaxID=1105319 RepID=A0AAJ0CXN9_9HYPO|nr:hypothetical protein QQS21_002459 [Conoideocrella luteorostrata]
MTSAAYAKDLLRRITPRQIEEEKRIHEVLSVVQQEVQHLVKIQIDRHFESVLDWLTPIDYSSKQNDVFHRHQPETCQWLFSTEQFQDWLKNKGQILFCPGVPGAGKTTLTSVAVNQLQALFHDDPTVGIAYVYCSYEREDDQATRHIVASLLKQLSLRQGSLPEPVEFLHKRHKDKTGPDCAQMVKTLEAVVSLYSRVYILVDALDECQASQGFRTALVSMLLGLCTTCRANLFATSRCIPEVSNMFQTSVTLEVRASEPDLRRYLEAQVCGFPRFVRRNLDLQQEIATTIINAVDGIFLLATLCVDSINDQVSVKDVRATLSDLPRGSKLYDRAYSGALRRIENQSSNQERLAKKVLMWIVCAKRPLKPLELQEALTVEIGEPTVDEDNRPDIEDMVSLCAGLVTIDEESNVIRLIHYTAHEYLQRTLITWYPLAQTDITSCCVTYLSMPMFHGGFSEPADNISIQDRPYPLFDYAARYWVTHARTVSQEPQLVSGFLASPSKIPASSLLWAAKSADQLLYSGSAKEA